MTDFMELFCFLCSVTRIKNETGVAIKIPSDSEGSSIIRIEGDPAGVQRAKAELLEMGSRMVSFTCMICNHLLFRLGGAPPAWVSGERVRLYKKSLICLCGQVS